MRRTSATIEYIKYLFLNNLSLVKTVEMEVFLTMTLAIWVQTMVMR